MPPSFRQQPESKKRYFWFWVLVGVLIARIWIYAFFGVLFSIVPKEYQLILGLISPLLREIVKFLLTRACNKAAGEDAYEKNSTKFACAHYAETTHAIAIAIIISGAASTESTLCILGMDFLINIYHGIKIVRLHNLGKESKISSIFHIICTIE